MGLRISTNLAAMAASRNLRQNSEEQAKTFARLSSGKRITQAADDAAGLAISERLRARIRSMSQAERNASDGISFAQTAEGGLSEINNIMVRLRELAIQAGSDTVGDKERGFIHIEVKKLLNEVDRIANVTSFNGIPLLNGEAPKSNLEFQVGVENHSADRVVLHSSKNDVRTSALGIDDLDYSSIDGARDSIGKIDAAMDKVAEARTRLGAMQENLHSTVNNLEITRENLTGARSRIADADMAHEASKLVRNNIMESAGVAVLAQANQAPMQALKLLD